MPDGVGSQAAGGDYWTEGDAYVWYDGDRRMEVSLASDLVVIGDDTDLPSSDGVDDTVTGRIVQRAVLDVQDVQVAEPVFRSESGELMTLPGGVLVILDSAWSSASVELFFGINGVTLDRVSELGWLPNGFYVDTDPGFASLTLANALLGQPGVESSTPNWLRSAVPK